MDDAGAILQATLDDLGAAVMADDWAGFLRRVILPFELQTEAGKIAVQDAPELRAGYDEFQLMLRTHRVTHYLRHARRAEFDGPDRIVGSYSSDILSHGKRILPAYTSLMVIDLRGGQWCASRIVNRWSNDRWPVLTPKPIDDAEPERSRK